MFCLYTLPLPRPAQAKIQMLTASSRIVTILLKSFLKPLEIYFQLKADEKTEGDIEMTTIKVMMSEREEMTFVTKETTSPMAAEITTTIAPSEFLDDDTADETVTEAVTNDILDESTTSKTTVTRPRAISVTDILVPTTTPKQEIVIGKFENIF